MKLILVSLIFVLSGCAAGQVFKAYYTAPFTIGIEFSTNYVVTTQPTTTQGSNK